MHAANPEKSERLARTLYIIRSFGKFGLTTAQLQFHTGSVAPSTDVAELRQHGYNVECEYEGKRDGRRIYRYTYRGRKES